MLKILLPIIKAVPTLISLLKSRTPEKGRGIVKSGIASLTISGLISTGKISAGGADGTLLLILSILETIGYLYGVIAVSSGAAQTHPVDELLKGKGEGLSNQQAKILGQNWMKQIQENQDYRISGASLFDDDYSDLTIKAEDISQVSIQNPTKEKP